MSTRCQIGFYSEPEQKLEDHEALIYRHSDGYPGTISGKYGVLTDIVPFLRRFYKVRGNDVEYASARLLQHLCNQYDSEGEALAKKMGYKSYSAGLLGHGISREFHWDIEYLYAVYPDRVEVHAVLGGWGKEQSFKKLKEVKL